jgi:hypothetical protein
LTAAPSAADKPLLHQQLLMMIVHAVHHPQQQQLLLQVPAQILARAFQLDEKVLQVQQQ